MHAVKVFVFLASVLLAALPMYSLDDPKVARAKYDELAARANKGDLNIDWQALRLDARVGEVYGEYGPYDASKRAQASFGNGNYEEALKIAREIEQHNIADVEAHFCGVDLSQTAGKATRDRQRVGRPACIGAIHPQVRRRQKCQNSVVRSRHSRGICHYASRVASAIQGAAQCEAGWPLLRHGPRDRPVRQRISALVQHGH